MSHSELPPRTSSSLPLMMRLIRTYVLRYWPRLALAALCMLVSAGLTGGMAKLMEPVMDKVLNGKNPSLLWPLGLTVIAVFAIRGAVTYCHNVIMNSLGQRVTSDANRDMFAHIINSDIAFLHDQQSGKLLSRFINDTAMMRVATVEGLTGLGKNTFTIIGLVFVMFYQDWRLSMISILVFPVSFYFVGKIGRKLRKLSTNSQVYMGEMTSILNQSLQGAKHIKSYVMEDYEKGRVNAAIEKIYSIATRSFRVSARVSPFTEVVSGFAISFIIIYGGHQVIEGQSTEGKLFSFIVAFGLAYDPIKRLANLNNTMQSGLAAVDRFFKLLDIKPGIVDKSNAGNLEISSAVVRFDNVSFSYPDGSEALRSVTLEAPAGKTIALVGESGAGKTTALGLIPRFYDVTGGAITIDGQDIRDVTMHSLRKNMALVSQEVAIFNDTIRDNIAYGRLGATEEEVIEAAKQAAAHDFIMELAEGYNTVVGENGLKLSGGQRQRISIARAMLKNAPILLLDEATSALDANSERLVQSALERLQQGRTTIVVAHRLSTIIGADIIYVMADGKVSEQGSHDALLAQGGAYARLYGNLMRESA